MTDYHNNVLADLANVFTPDGRAEHRGGFHLVGVVAML